MTDSETRCRTIAMRAVSASIARCEPNEEAALMAAFIEFAGATLVALDADEAEAAIIQAARRARLNAKMRVAAEQISQIQTFDEIVEAFARKKSVSLDDLKGWRRTNGLSELKQELYHHLYSIRDASGNRRWSQAEIARRLGKDHTTIRWGYLRHEDRLKAASADLEAVA